MKKTALYLALAALLTACNSGIPDNYRESDLLPRIYPDYTDVTIPVNIAPLTFETDGAPQDMVARFTAGDRDMLIYVKYTEFDKWGWNGGNF